MKKSKMKKLKGLQQFKYCDVASSFKLTVSSDLDYFKNKIHKKVRWDSKKVDLSSTPDTAAFDSGIVCATSDALPMDTDEVLKLECYFAPYKFMRDTIGTIKEPCKKTENPNTDNSGIAFGMVLSIIATKGSAENGNRTPYMLFVKRGDLEIRGNQLDVPVVEGINCGDFKNCDNGNYCAELSEIAKRALEEERGINVDFLLSKGLLRMPQKYYFGYDAGFCQWNFFGTVVIDCTIEEIIREGCYYTKDKFETKEIIGIPADPRVLFYYLSDKMIPIHNREGEQEATTMWNTAWASVMFAIRDYHEEKTYKAPERKCLRRKNHPGGLNEYGRKVLNGFASILVRHKYASELACALIPVVMIALFVLSIVGQVYDWGDCVFNILGIIENGISLIATLWASWVIVAIVRYDIVNRKDIVKLNTHWRNNNEQSLMFPEVSAFRNIVLKDGNIAENTRKIYFRYQHTRNLNGRIEPQRKCQMSYTQADGDKAWGMKDFTQENVEDILWVIKCCDKTKNGVRIVAPLIIKKRGIIFKNKNNKLFHCVDFEIPYSKFVGKSDKNIKEMLNREIKNQLFLLYRFNSTIKFKFLLENNGQSVIVAFLESDIPSTSVRSLSYDFTETSFSKRLKDDITRVACEYANAEYIGYKMSKR